MKPLIQAVGEGVGVGLNRQSTRRLADRSLDGERSNYIRISGAGGLVDYPEEEEDKDEEEEGGREHRVAS